VTVSFDDFMVSAALAVGDSGNAVVPGELGDPRAKGLLSSRRPTSCALSLSAVARRRMTAGTTGCGGERGWPTTASGRGRQPFAA